MNRFGMDECHLEAEQAVPRRRVDELGAPRRELSERLAHVVHLVGDVVHPGPALGEELADRRIRGERREQLDPRIADPQRHRLDPLLLDARTVLEHAPEETLVRPDGLVEVGDCNPDVVDTSRLHWGDVSVRRPTCDGS